VLTRRPLLGINNDVPVEMEPGDLFIFLASSIHGAGHNSVPDSTRTIYGLFFIRGYLRQEENQYLTIPRSQVLKMSDKMKALLGYKMTSSLLGMVDSLDPMTNLPAVLERVSA
jgi:swainsonine biosynthesis dioxygenase SwnH1/2